MKAFVIFPTICVFALTLALLKFDGQLRPRTALLWSTIATIIFGVFMTWLSVDVFFFLYYANFLGIIILIPCLTYLTNELFKDNSEKIKWFRILGLGLVSTILTLVIFATSMFFSFAYNPMDPAPRQGQMKNDSH
jgi:O-antigen/teichoic acid export membrane protein